MWMTTIRNVGGQMMCFIAVALGEERNGQFDGHIKSNVNMSP